MIHRSLYNSCHLCLVLWTIFNRTSLSTVLLSVCMYLTPYYYSDFLHCFNELYYCKSIVSRYIGCWYWQWFHFFINKITTKLRFIYVSNSSISLFVAKHVHLKYKNTRKQIWKDVSENSCSKIMRIRRDSMIPMQLPLFNAKTVRNNWIHGSSNELSALAIEKMYWYIASVWMSMN